MSRSEPVLPAGWKAATGVSAAVLVVALVAVAVWVRTGPSPDLEAEQVGEYGAFFVLSDEEAAEVDDPHELPLCQACHPNADPELSDHPSTLCEGCHTVDHQSSHPVGVVQTEPPDPELPLWREGEVVCHSCHDPHDLGDLPGGLRMTFNTMCNACHFPGKVNADGTAK